MKRARKAKRAATKRAAAKRAAKKAVPPIPTGFHSVTPQLTVKGAAQALEFYKRAFGARELMRMPGPDGQSLMHAEIRIGDSIVFVNDEFPEMGPGPRAPQSLGGTTGTLHVYVRNVDAAFKRAVEAGARETMAPADMFWGDRYGKVVDPYGHEWGLATHKENLTPAQQRKRGEAFVKQMGQRG